MKGEERTFHFSFLSASPLALAIFIFALLSPPVERRRVHIRRFQRRQQRLAKRAEKEDVQKGTATEETSPNATARILREAIPVELGGEHTSQVHVPTPPAGRRGSNSRVHTFWTMASEGRPLVEELKVEVPASVPRLELGRLGMHRPVSASTKRTPGSHSRPPSSSASSRIRAPGTSTTRRPLSQPWSTRTAPR